MKILLDHCVHIGVRKLLPGHSVSSSYEVGLDRLSNGELLDAAVGLKFDVLMTTDKNIRHQHDLASLPLPIIELNTRFTRIADLQAVAPAFEAALALTAECRFVSINDNGVVERVA